MWLKKEKEGGKIYMGDTMIKKFSVKNYRNFKDKITLDFSKIGNYDFNEYCIRDNILTKTMIYGQNGVGKSNLGFALFDIVQVLTDRHITEEKNNDRLFLNADSMDKKVEFYYELVLDKYKIVYEYHKKDSKRLSYEELLVNDDVIFSYDFEKNEFICNNLDKVGAETLNFEFYESSTSILRYIAHNGNIGAMPTIKLIMSFVNGMLWFRSLERNQFIGMNKNITNLIDYLVVNDYLKDFQKFLNKVTGINYLLEPNRDDITEEKRILEVHQNGKLDFWSAASNGTRALTLFYYWMTMFQDATFVWIDEFDAFYHFELSRNIAKEVLAYEKSQIVFTTHNTYLMSNELLRPDAYFILRNGKVKGLPELTFRELRQGHNLEKLFRNGEFEDEKE